jgi:hypothetical protein
MNIEEVTTGWIGKKRRTTCNMLFSQVTATGWTTTYSKIAIFSTIQNYIKRNQNPPAQQ